MKYPGNIKPLLADEEVAALAPLTESLNDITDFNAAIEVQDHRGAEALGRTARRRVSRLGGEE